MITLSYFGLFNYARGIILLDYITSSFSGILLKRGKSVDFVFISLIKFYSGQLIRLSALRRRRFLTFNFNLLL